jgi:serine/threonine protein kinase
MELVKGGSLKKFLIKRRKNKKPLCEDEVRIIMKNILEGLSYIHSKDIIHRDIKLENVLIHHFKDLSSIKIADFGLGARFDTSVADNCGTLLYMAPEVASNKKYTKVCA